MEPISAVADNSGAWSAIIALAGFILGAVIGLLTMARNVGKFESRVLETEKSIVTLNKVIFKDTGGLNFITHPEHDKMQFNCQSMFQKDIVYIKEAVEEIKENSGFEKLSQMLDSIKSIEHNLAVRLKFDKERKV